MLRISKIGLSVLKSFEGCKLEAYQDIVGVWTIGYGFTLGVKAGDVMTQAECDARLVRELDSYEKVVFAATNGKVSQNEFDALVSLAWNIGIAGMKKSSVIKAHNKGDKAAAARAFGLWNKAGGKVVNGLVRRRAAEAALYLTTPVEDLFAIPGVQADEAMNVMAVARSNTTETPTMPQKVDSEKPLTNSTTIIAGSTAAVVTTVQQLGLVKDSVASLGVLPSEWLLPLIVLAALAYIIYERINNRNNGNA